MSSAAEHVLYFHPASSASLRVMMAARLRGLNMRVVEVGMKRDEKGIPKWLLPDGSPEANRLGTREWEAFNPEGRVPVLMIDGNMMTQTGAIIEYLEEVDPSALPSLLPSDPLLRAEARRVMWIIAADGMRGLFVICRQNLQTRGLFDYNISCLVVI
jgi:glutathione S-transferase